jgi:DNA repair exonuclease SbcCD ATPase subunit
MKNNFAINIKNRFEEEQKNIEEYLRFLEYKISFLNSDLLKIEQLLVKYRILTTENKYYHLPSQNEELNKEEIKCNEIIKNKSQIEKRLLEINDLLERFHYPEKLNTIDIRTEKYPNSMFMDLS